MKVTFSLFAFFLLNAFSCLANAPQSLLDQLQEINHYWTVQDYSPAIDDILMRPVSDLPENTAIQMHLALVESELRSRTCDHLSAKQQGRREAGLDILRKYWQPGVFPVNNQYDYRIPYFVDDLNTACAVGQIMREGGELLLFSEIVQKMNNAFVKDMNLASLHMWADENGFTVEELKWIQPTYGDWIVPTVTQESTCMEANGELSLNGGWQFVESFQPGYEMFLHWLVNDTIVESSISSDFSNIAVYNNYPAGRYDFRLMILDRGYWRQKSLFMSIWKISPVLNMFFLILPVRKCWKILLKISQKFEIDLIDLNLGIYFLKMQTSRGDMGKRILLK